MFKKPFRIKSNTQMKSSDRKLFKDTLLKTFPNLTEPQVDEILPKKEALSKVMIVTHSNAIVTVYTIKKKPVIFETDNIIFPTIFLLWDFPNLLYAFTTHQQVMRYISSGADLMLPGVVTPPPHSGLSKYGCVSERDVVCVNMTDNIAAIAVGVASQSSAAMMLEGSRGKCVDIYHFLKDNLCTLDGYVSDPIPHLGPPVWLQKKSFDEDFPALGSTRRQTPVENEPPEQNEEVQTINVKEDSETGAECLESVEDSIEDMDELLYHCFLGALKYSKNLTLPVLTSNFYALHMLPLCPGTHQLEIKKTSFKKLKPFLKKMSEEGLITVKEIKGGVEAITAINKDHSRLQEFHLSPSDRPKKKAEDKDNATATTVVQSYVITERVLPIFGDLSKGDVVHPAEMRQYVHRYVKGNNLQDDKLNSMVKPNDVLAKVCKTEDPISWEEVMNKVCDAMKKCYKVTTGTDEISNKGNLPPISMSVSTRSGNKKVTLIDNLELYGIRLAEFAKECQHKVGASTSISRPIGKKCDQLMVQGNQVAFVYNLLTETYKVPKKYIKGLEFAPRKK